jgi:hypothetical protein
MSAATLKSVFERAASLPDEDQVRLARMAELIEAQHTSLFDFDDEDWNVIDERSNSSEFAAPEEMKRVFSKYGTA